MIELYKYISILLPYLETCSGNIFFIMYNIWGGIFISQEV